MPSASTDLSSNASKHYPIPFCHFVKIYLLANDLICLSEKKKIIVKHTYHDRKRKR